MLIDDQLSSAKAKGQRLRFLRKMARLPLLQFAEKYQIGTSTIKYWECAANEGLSPKGAKKILAAMQNEGIQCSYTWLMHGIGLPPQLLDIRYNNHKITLDDSDLALKDELLIKEEITLYCSRAIHAITTLIFDNGLEPTYCMGDNVGGQRLTKNNLSNAVGKDCIIETADNEILCRRVAASSQPNRFNLYCTNPHTTVDTPNLYNIAVTSLAPITRLWKRY